MLHFRLLIAAALLQAIAALPAAAEKRVALVIGNSAYVNAGALANPVNDASDTAQALKKFGFEVILGLDLTRSAFEKMVRGLCARFGECRYGGSVLRRSWPAGCGT